MPTFEADFGGSMCEFDGVLVVGAPHHDMGVLGSDQGTVFIFKFAP